MVSKDSGCRNKPWTVKELDYVRDHARQKASVLGAKLGRTASAIRMVKKRLQACCAKPKESKEELIEQYRIMHAEGHSDMIIASRLGIGQETARRYRIELGLTANRWNDAMKEIARDRVRQTHKRDRQSKKRMNEIVPGQETQSTDDIHRVYTDEETRFLRAIVEFRSRYGKIPTLADGYRILLSLGWRKEP